MGVDLIITSPNKLHHLLMQSVQHDTGIPVILLDRKIDGDKYTQLSIYEQRRYRTYRREYVTNALLLTVVSCEIKGLEELLVESTEITVREGIKKNDKIEIVAVNNADWLREKAITVAEEMLQTNDDQKDEIIKMMVGRDMSESSIQRSY